AAIQAHRLVDALNPHRINHLLEFGLEFLQLVIGPCPDVHQDRCVSANDVRVSTAADAAGVERHSRSTTVQLERLDDYPGNGKSRAGPLFRLNARVGGLADGVYPEPPGRLASRNDVAVLAGSFQRQDNIMASPLVQQQIDRMSRLN